MKPWFDKFTGRVFSNEDGLWITEGVWKSSGKNIISNRTPTGALDTRLQRVSRYPYRKEKDYELRE